MFWIFLCFWFKILFSTPLDEELIKAASLSVLVYDGGVNDCSSITNRFGGTVVKKGGGIIDNKYCLWQDGMTKDSTMWLVIRGSQGIGDWLKNALNFIEVHESSIKAFVRQEFLSRAKTIWSEIETDVKNYPGKVYFVGHSRGGSIAEVTHVYGRRKLLESGNKASGEKLNTIVFAPAPVMSESGDVIDVKHKMTVFIHNDDVVPRLTLNFFASTAKNALKNALCGIANPVQSFCNVLSDIYSAAQIAWRQAAERLCVVTVDRVAGTIYHLVGSLLLDCFGKESSIESTSPDLQSCLSNTEEILLGGPGRVKQVSKFNKPFEAHDICGYEKYLRQMLQKGSNPSSTGVCPVAPLSAVTGADGSGAKAGLKPGLGLLTNLTRVGAPYSPEHHTRIMHSLGEAPLGHLSNALCPIPSWMPTFENETEDCYEDVISYENGESFDAYICSNEDIEYIEVYSDDDFSDSGYTVTVYAENDNNTYTWQYTTDFQTCSEAKAILKVDCEEPDWIKEYSSNDCKILDQNTDDTDTVHLHVECTREGKTCSFNTKVSLLYKFCEFEDPPQQCVTKVPDAAIATVLGKGTVVFVSLLLLVMVFNWW